MRENRYTLYHLILLTSSGGEACALPLGFWGFFDEERLLEDKCQVLQASHHGSKNGTQWERIERFNPSAIVVSSDPDGKHMLPDLVGSAIFRSMIVSMESLCVLPRIRGLFICGYHQMGKGSLK